MNSLESGRPFVYRQFVPLGGQLISRLAHITVDQGVVTVILMCAVAFAYSLKFLYHSFHPEQRAERFVLTGVCVLFLLIAYPKHTYDVPTAFFFTLAFALFERRKLKAYVWLFPWICLNRETAFLLPLLFAVHFFHRLDRRSFWFYLCYQVGMFVAIRLALILIFADAPGSNFYFRPLENFEMYKTALVTTNFLLLLGIAVLALVRVKWSSAPALARTAFLIFGPMLVILYVFLGVSFEIRVFVELLPAILIISASRGDEKLELSATSSIREEFPVGTYSTR